jgi:hypothetical protein
MFNKIEISLPRAFFWLTSAVIYWGMIFFSWWDTRYRIFYGAEIFKEFFTRRKLSSLFQTLSPADATALEQQVWMELANNGALPTVFMIVPLVMAMILLIAPFTVRRDCRGPVTGIVSLPLTTFLTYLCVSLLNTMLAAGITGGLFYTLDMKPSPDFFMFLIHPAYLLFPPAMKNLAGFLSQCLYIAFIASVLTVPNRFEEQHEDIPPVAERGSALFAALPRRENAPLRERAGEEGEEESDEDSDWNRSACVMEMDRMSRILNSKFQHPALINNMRLDIADYIKQASRVNRDIRNGITHYQIVLRQAERSFRRTIEAEGAKPGAIECLTYIVDELARMEFSTKQEAETARAWIAEKVLLAAQEKTGSAKPEEVKDDGRDLAED